MQSTKRSCVPEMEEIIGKEFKVLDKGFVRLIDYMGDDSAIVQAARVSYGQGTKTVNEDAGLISYLMRHRHTTPFEMCEIKLHVKLPIFIARQWFRHRTANVNELSGRYSVIKDDFFVPESHCISEQSKDAKQGRDKAIDPHKASMISQQIESHALDSFAKYNHLLEEYNLTREVARVILPQSAYTEMYWKIDLHNLLHFLSLRMASGAQKEIRDYANVIANDMVQKWVPKTYQSFLDSRVNSVNFIGQDLEHLASMMDRDKLVAFVEEHRNSKKGVMRELSDKLSKLIPANNRVDDGDNL